MRAYESLKAAKGHLTHALSAELEGTGTLLCAPVRDGQGVYQRPCAAEDQLQIVRSWQADVERPRDILRFEESEKG
jgi:hypothetical protein